MQLPWISGGIALVIVLAPLFSFGFAGQRCIHWAESLPVGARLALPAVLVAPYCIVALATHTLSARWLAIYLVAPVAVAPGDELSVSFGPLGHLSVRFRD